MKVKAFAFSAFLLASVSLFSQENETKEPFNYSNITEFGFFATSPRSIAFEATTVNGFSMDKKNCLGIGFGFGYLLGLSNDYDFFYLHMPMFVNYRLYFNPSKTFSPHVNVALGGTMVTKGGGFYSAVTVGFRAAKFSFSSGISFMPIRTEVREDISYYDDYGLYLWRENYVKKWLYPLGFTIKCGFSF